MGLKHRSNKRPKGKGNCPGLFVAFLILLVWLPIPLGSNRPWSWALMEVWVFLMAAVWLIKYARGRVTLTEPFRQARLALLLLYLWLGYGIVQMIPLPMTAVATISPNTATLYQQARLAPLFANQDIAPNRVSRPLPSFADRTDTGEISARDGEVQPAGSGQEYAVAEPDLSAVDDPDATRADTSDMPVGVRPPATASADCARLTLDLSASLTAWLKSLAYILLFILTLLLIDSRERLKKLAFALVLSGLGQAVYGSLALAVAGGGVASGTFVNRNHYAAYLVLCLSVGIGLLIASMGRSASAESWRQRLRHIGKLILSGKAPLRIFLAIMVIALVLTRSRMGNTAFFASLLITGALALILFKEMPRTMMLLITSLLVIDIIIIGSWVGIEQVKERLEQTTLAQENRDEIDIYSYKMWQDYPFFGSGAGSYYSVYPSYRKGSMGEGILEHAHNDYLEFLTEYGILGLVFPAGVVILALQNTILAQRKRRSHFTRGMGFAALMAVTAMLIHATVEFNLQIPAYAASFMVILATAWLIRYLKSE